MVNDQESGVEWFALIQRQNALATKFWTGAVLVGVGTITTLFSKNTSPIKLLGISEIAGGPLVSIKSFRELVVTQNRIHDAVTSKRCDELGKPLGSYFHR